MPGLPSPQDSNLFHTLLIDACTFTCQCNRIMYSSDKLNDYNLLIEYKVRGYRKLRHGGSDLNINFITILLKWLLKLVECQITTLAKYFSVFPSYYRKDQKIFVLRKQI